jgi:WD40 repeat protein
VYHTITFANLHVLKGHQGEVTHVTWSQDDLKLVSCADNGSVYEWNAATGDHLIEKLIIKQTKRVFLPPHSFC